MPQVSVVSVKVSASAKHETQWWRWLSLVVIPVGWSLVAAVRGPKWEQLIVGLVLMALAQAGQKASSFSLNIFPILAVGMFYELLSLALPFRADIHVGDIYNAELALFGVNLANTIVTPAAWFQTHNTAPLDLLTGALYLSYIPEVFGVAAFLWFVDRSRMARLTWGFFLLNIMGQLTWLLWPVAPPWYVDAHGAGAADLNALPSAAGAARFDALVGSPIFEDFYSRSVNVFGAMPSLHAAYPAIVLLATWTLGVRWRWVTGSTAALMGFSAVYLGHHYILDVLVGYLYAFVAYAAVSRLMNRSASEVVP